MGFSTPMIKIWNPICNRYQWVRIVIPLGKIHVVCLTENNQCSCMNNKFLVVSESQVFRYSAPHAPNEWVNKPLLFPKPDLGVKNVYTNKYMGIDMIALHKFAIHNYPRYIKFSTPITTCNKKELK